MICNETRQFLDAYVDGELEITRAVEIEQHLETCPDCHALVDSRRKFTASVRSEAPYFEAPRELEARIRARIHEAGKTPAGLSLQSSSFPWSMAAIAASLAFLVALTTLLVQNLRRPSAADLIAKEVVADHIRSLMGNHLADVPSSDQHTVKPWFAGKIDFAPVVKDLASDGFPLTGGRLDYLDGRPVAALLYKRHQHTINLFLWPVASSDSGLQTFSLKGYNVIHWIRSGMNYWVVSDLNLAELTEFVHDQQR